MGLRAVVARCRDRGYEPTLHPETGTWVEAPWEVEAAMELCDVGVCLETGHLYVGGGDPARLDRATGRGASTTCTSRTPTAR